MSFDPVSYAMGRAAAPGGTDVSDTTATAADVLSGKAFYLANGTKTQGSIASKAAQTYTPTTADQTIAAGQYLSGAQTVKGDANLVAGNIKKDVTIFGVTGSHEGGGGTLPTLNAPSLSVNGLTLTITNPASNGNYVTGYKLYVNGVFEDTVQTTSVDLSSMLETGTYLITARAYGTNFNDSAESNAASVTIGSDNPYVTFSAAAPFAVGTQTNGGLTWNGTHYYSTDAQTWNTWNGAKINAALSDGLYKLYMRAENCSHYSYNGNSYTLFTLTGDATAISVSGNIENLLDYNVVANGQHPTMDDYAFYRLFSNQTKLVSAPDLPCPAMTSYCYSGMFSGTSLASPPKIEAATAGYYSCSDMFNQTALTTPPALKATVLSANCYYMMFANCPNLTVLPELPATQLAQNCYGNMFANCSSLKISETQTGDYQYAYRIPTSGTGSTASYWNSGMFGNTGGTFTGAPSVNTTYYTDHAPVPAS